MKKIFSTCAILLAILISKISFANPIFITCFEYAIKPAITFSVSQNWEHVITQGFLVDSDHQEYEFPFTLNCKTPLKSNEPMRCEGQILTHTEDNVTYTMNGELLRYYSGKIEFKLKNMLTIDGRTVDMDRFSYFLSIFGLIKYEKMPSFPCRIDY